MERFVFYIWFLYRRLIYRVFKKIDRSNGLAFTLVFFELLPLPFITILVLSFKLNNHLLAKIYASYTLICIIYLLYLSLAKEGKREKYFQAFQKKPESRIRRILIPIVLFYPVIYVILIIIFKKITAK